jgi:transcriptional regulator with XRE-family HTH domain
MTNTELTKIREDRKLSKKEFAALIGVTPMLLGRYEKGTCAIPDSVAEKLTATEIEVKKNTRKAGRKAKEVVAEVKEAVEDKAVAEEIEVKKAARKAGRKAKEAVEVVAQSDPVVAAEIEVKKNTRKAGRKAKEKVEGATTVVKETAKKAAGIPNIVIQSPMGGYITFSDIVKKVPKGAADIYVRVDENKLYYVLENGETGDVDIWE